MPVQRCQSDGKPGYRWGESGKCYTYTAGDKESRERAKRLAARQGAAAHASGYKESIKKAIFDAIREFFSSR